MFVLTSYYTFCTKVQNTYIYVVHTKFKIKVPLFPFPLPTSIFYVSSESNNGVCGKCDKAEDIVAAVDNENGTQSNNPPVAKTNTHKNKTPCALSPVATATNCTRVANNNAINPFTPNNILCFPLIPPLIFVLALDSSILDHAIKAENEPVYATNMPYDKNNDVPQDVTSETKRNVAHNTSKVAEILDAYRTLIEVDPVEDEEMEDEEDVEDVEEDDEPINAGNATANVAII